jgi:amino acid transporter
LAYSGLHPQNFGSNFQEFAPFGWKGIFVCVISSGVVMSFNGFQTPMTFSEEISSPRKMLPIAVGGSILVAFVVYFLLQMVFVGSIDPMQVAKGWQSINFRSPYAELLLLANMHLMAMMVYFASVVSPAACGAAFTASSSRILYALSKEKHLPAYLSRLHPVYFSPRNSIVTCVVVGCVFLFMFKGWYSLVAVISILHIFSYLSAPIVTMANRIKHCQSVESEKQFKLPFAHVLAPLTMFVLSVLLFYATWPITAEMALLIVPGLALFLYYENRYYKDEQTNAWRLIKGASWIFIYLLGISIVCYLGDDPYIGTHQITVTHSMILLALLSVGVYIYGAYFAYDKQTYHNGK